MCAANGVVGFIGSEVWDLISIAVLRVHKTS